MQASEVVFALAGRTGCLNLRDSGGGCLVTTLQVDESVYVVGQDDYSVGKYSLVEWRGDTEQTEVPLIEADTAVQALELLLLMSEGCALWQCGSCDAWIHTSQRWRTGILRCANCLDGGVDFYHAARNVGVE
jgi:hypothetical protein